MSVRPKKMEKKYYFLFLILIFSMFIVNLQFIVSLTWADSGTWSQSTQAEFETCTLSNIDTSTSPGDVSLSGAYSSDSNTVLLLHMNESSWNGTINEVVDSSSYGNHGTANGDATTTANGKFSRAGAFGGTSRYVNYGNNASLDITSAVTIEAWVRPNALENCIVDKGYRYGPQFAGWRIFSYATALMFGLGNGTELITISSDAPLPLKEWTHIAVFWDKSRMKMAINGIIQSDTYGFTGPIHYAGFPHLLLGRWHYSDKGFFNGFIDEVRISNKIRSLDEVNTDGGYFSSGTITTARINSGKNITNIRLNWKDTRPAGTSITYSATNDGGVSWYELPGDNVLFTFPSPGNDLRIKAELRRGSGTPTLHSWSAEFSGAP